MTNPTEHTASFQSILAELKAFLKNPSHAFPRLATFQQRGNIIKLIVLMLALDFVLVAVWLPIPILLGAEEMASDEMKTLFRDNKALLFLLAVFLAPIMEEGAFRLPLRFSLLNFSLGFVGLLLVSANLVNIVGAAGVIIAAGLQVAIVLATIFYLSHKREERTQQITDWWSRHLSKLFYGSVIAFGLVHMSNYQLSGATLLLGPLLTMPQMILGALLGYIRLKQGFWYAVGFHALHNFIVVGLAFMGEAFGA